ncbi:MAG: histidinol-phosphate transaminase [Pseudomonadota bacterium]|nr:histidinol-phosphate transaminase [Pseudomonadota bacterium]
MSIDFFQAAAPGVRRLAPYEPGKSAEVVERELGITESIKLASNENPLGPSPLARQAAAQALCGLGRYPDGGAFTLKQSLAARHQVAENQLTIGAGSSDLLRLVVQSFVTPGAEVIVSQYAFAMYAIYASAVDAELRVVPAKNWGHDLSAMAAAVSPATRVLFIANPNNPTGTWVDHQALVDLLDRVPRHVIVVLDEAYAEYVNVADYPDGIALTHEYPNLVVTRTFSKAHGLAALRIGYSISHPQVADLMNRIREPFNGNSVALAAAVAALGDAEHVERSRQANAAGMRQVALALDAIKLQYIPSIGNFLAVETPGQAAPYYEALLRRGVIVRPLGGYGMPQHLRVTVGTPEENSRFIDAMRGVCAELR